MPTLAEVLEGAVGGFRAPGAVVVVQRNGTEPETASAHIDPSSLFEIGSVAKTMTALLVLQHAQSGIIGLDDPITTYLPDFHIASEGATQRVTIRHLLTHTSGLDCGDDFTDTGDGDDCLERFVMEVLPEVGLLHEPGERWSYCNGGYSILGHLLEVLSGSPWDDLLIERVIDPLGLSATTTARLGPQHRIVTGHRYDPTTRCLVEESGRMPRSAGPAGNVVATAFDLVRFSETLFSGTDHLLDPTLVNEMITPQFPIREGHQGLAWVLPRANVAVHGGSTRGWTAFLAAIPGFGSLSVVADGPGAGAIAGEIQAHLFGSVPRREPVPSNLAPIDLEACVGRFARRHVQITIDLQDDNLVAASTWSGPAADLFPPVEPVVLEPIGGASFISRRDYEDGFATWDFDDLSSDGLPSRLLTRRLTNRVS